MNESLTQLARYNFSALCTLARFLDSRGYWTTKRDIAADVAETVHSLFEALAWADGSLHARECWLIEAVLEQDEEFSAHVKEHFANGSAQNPVPGCLAAAALHDSIHKTAFAELFFESPGEPGASHHDGRRFDFSSRAKGVSKSLLGVAA